MTSASIARRYAGVLFDITQGRGTTDRAQTELEGLRDLVSSHEQLRHVFETPVVPAARKRQLIDALLDASGSSSDEIRRLAVLLAERDRLMLLPAIAAVFSERVMRSRNLAAADVVTAVPLSEADRAKLAGALAKAVGSQVTLHERVDPDIIGGVVARVGTLVFDGSVTRQIERLRAQLGTD